MLIRFDALSLQVEGYGPMLGVYETACDMLLDMSEACRAVAAERPDGGAVGDVTEAITLEHWRRARSLLHSHA